MAVSQVQRLLMQACISVCITVVLAMEQAGKAARNVDLTKEEQLAVKGLGLITIKVRNRLVMVDTPATSLQPTYVNVMQLSGNKQH
jgi:hypothetical protein